MSATERPWRIELVGGMPIILSGNTVVLELPYNGDQINRGEVAALIVKAVNSHDELVEALEAISAEAERMTMTMRRRKIFDAAREVLARARGEQP